MASRALQIVITGDAKSAQRALASLNRSLGQTETKASQSGKGITGSIDGIGGAMSSMGSMALSAAAGLTVGLGVAAGAASAWGLSVASANEQAEVSFTNLLGSAGQAQDFLTELRDFSAATPFEFGELTGAASRLVAVGTEADRVIPIMEALGDATSGMGTGSEGIDRAVTALGQMQQSGRVSLEEINQLTEAGIPIVDALAARFETTGGAIRDMASDGRIAVDDVFGAIEERSGPAFERLDGMMEAQSMTLAGMLSTMKDTLGQGLATTVEPLMDAAKDVLPVLSDAAGDAALAFQPLMGAVAAFAPIFGELAADWAEHATPMLEAVGEFAQNFTDQLLPELEPVMDDVEQMMIEISDGIIEVMVAAEPLIPVLVDITVALLEVGVALNPLGPMLQVTAELVEAVADAWSFTPTAGMLAAFSDSSESLGELNPLVGENAEAMKEQADAAKEAEDAMSRGAGVIDTYRGRVEDVNTEIMTLVGDLGEANTALEEALNAGIGDGWRDMTSGLEASLDVGNAMADTFTGLGENMPDGLSFDKNTQEGRDNVALLLQYREAIAANADSLIAQTGSTEDAENATRLYADQMAEMLRQMGVGDDEIRDLQEQMGLLPEQFGAAFDSAQDDINLTRYRVAQLNNDLTKARDLLREIQSGMPAGLIDGERQAAQGAAYWQNGTNVNYGESRPTFFSPIRASLNKDMGAKKGPMFTGGLHIYDRSPKQSLDELAWRQRAAY